MRMSRSVVCLPHNVGSVDGMEEVSQSGMKADGLMNEQHNGINGSGTPGPPLRAYKNSNTKSRARQ